MGIVEYFAVSKDEQGWWLIQQQLEPDGEVVGAILTEDEAQYLAGLLADGVAFLREQREGELSEWMDDLATPPQGWGNTK